MCKMKKLIFFLTLLLTAGLGHTQVGISVNSCSGHFVDLRVDFDVCNPFNVQFTNLTVGSTAILWRFEGNDLIPGSDFVSHLYTQEGVYNVMMITQSKTTGCKDTIYKNFLMNVDSGTIFKNREEIVCREKTFTLPGDPASTKNCWWPDTYLNQTNIYNPKSTPKSEILYHNLNFKSKNNVVLNSSFNSYNKYFTTDYLYDSVNNTSGYFYTGPLPKIWNPDYENCFMDLDTLFTGDTMMFVNGSTKPGMIVWKQKVPVIPNTNYSFSFFGRSLTKNDSVELTYNINKGEVRGSKILSDATCVRSRFSTSWYSGNDTLVEISISDINIDSTENNFAIDSISLRPTFINYDTLQISFVPPPVFTINCDSTNICFGDTVNLTATGGDKYQWSPASIMFNPNEAKTPAIPKENTTFSVIITENKCSITDTLYTNLAIKALPKVSLGKSNDIDCSTPITNLVASGGVSYSWQPQQSLSNPYIANPVARPRETTTYICAIQGGNSCISIAAIRVDFAKSNSTPFLMPSAFTPNGDGLNDCFGVKNRGILNDVQLSVFNRFGTRIFYSNNQANCWDGKYKGIPQGAGTYVYTLAIDGLCGKEIHNGTVVIVR